MQPLYPPKGQQNDEDARQVSCKAWMQGSRMQHAGMHACGWECNPGVLADNHGMRANVQARLTGVASSRVHVLTKKI